MKEEKMRTYLILLFVTTIANSFLFCQDPEVLLAEANSKMKIGELKSADSLLNEALKIDPSFAPAHVGFSELWLRKGDLVKANESATKAVQMDEDFRSWWNGLNDIRSRIQNGKRNVQQGQFDSAIQEYEAITEKYPYFPEAQFYMGLTKFRQKDIEGAAFYFSEALKIYPGHQKARKGLNNVTKQLLNNGNKAYKRGDIEKASQYYLKAVTFDEQFYLAFYQLGVLEKKMGNSDLAISYFNKAIEIKPDFHKAWFTLGTSYEVDNNLDSAIVKYNKAIELNPGYTKAYNNLGNIYTVKEDYDSAKDVLLTAIQIDPTYADAYLRLGVVFSEQELFIEASEQFEKATEYNEKNYDAWFRYASTLNSIKQYDDASFAAQKCIDIKMKFGGGWYEKGVAEHGKGNKTRALKYFDEANKYRDWRKLAQRKIDEINNPTKYEK
jgi:tetratricopeptide (TPR) repeat protein